MGTDVGPEIWGTFRKAYNTGGFLDRPKIYVNIISGSGGRLLQKPSTQIHMLCNSWDSVNQEETEDRYWLGHLLFEYVKGGPDSSRSVPEVAEFLKDRNSMLTVEDVCGSSLSSLQIENGVVLTRNLPPPPVTNNLAVTGDPSRDNSLEVFELLSSNVMTSELSVDVALPVNADDDEDLYCSWLGHSFFEYVKDQKGNGWMGTDVGPEIWGTFRKAYNTGGFLDRPKIYVNIISGSGGRLLQKPSTQIHMLCNSWDSVNQEETEDRYWLGHLLFEYVKGGPDSSRSVPEVAEFLKDRNSMLTVEDVCGSSLSSLQIENGVVLTRNLPPPPVTNNLAVTGTPDRDETNLRRADSNRFPTTPFRPRPATVSVSMVEYWAGHLLMEYINEQPRKFLKEENLGYFFYRFKSMPTRLKVEVAGIIDDSGNRLIVRGNRFRLGSRPFENCNTTKYWLGRAIFEYVFAAPQNKRSEKDVFDHFVDCLPTPDALNSLCFSSFNYLIRIKKNRGEAVIQCGNGDPAYRRRILMESNLQTSEYTNIHGTDDGGSLTAELNDEQVTERKAVTLAGFKSLLW